MKSNLPLAVIVGVVVALGVAALCGAHQAPQSNVKYHSAIVDGVPNNMTVTDMIGFLQLIQAEDPSAVVTFELDENLRKSVRYLSYTNVTPTTDRRNNLYWDKHQDDCNVVECPPKVVVLQ